MGLGGSLSFFYCRLFPPPAAMLQDAVILAVVMLVMALTFLAGPFVRLRGIASTRVQMSLTSYSNGWEQVHKGPPKTPICCPGQMVVFFVACSPPEVLTSCKFNRVFFVSILSWPPAPPPPPQLSVSVSTSFLSAHRERARSARAPDSSATGGQSGGQRRWGGQLPWVAMAIHTASCACLDVFAGVSNERGLK